MEAHRQINHRGNQQEQTLTTALPKRDRYAESGHQNHRQHGRRVANQKIERGRKPRCMQIDFAGNKSHRTLIRYRQCPGESLQVCLRQQVAIF